MQLFPQYLHEHFLLFQTHKCIIYKFLFPLFIPLHTLTDSPDSIPSCSTLCCSSVHYLLTTSPLSGSGKALCQNAFVISHLVSLRPTIPLILISVSYLLMFWFGFFGGVYFCWVLSFSFCQEPVSSLLIIIQVAQNMSTETTLCYRGTSGVCIACMLEVIHICLKCVFNLIEQMWYTSGHLLECHSCNVDMRSSNSQCSVHTYVMCIPSTGNFSQSNSLLVKTSQYGSGTVSNHSKSVRAWSLLLCIAPICSIVNSDISSVSGISSGGFAFQVENAIIISIMN